MLVSIKKPLDVLEPPQYTPFANTFPPCSVPLIIVLLLLTESRTFAPVTNEMLSEELSVM